MSTTLTREKIEEDPFAQDAEAIEEVSELPLDRISALAESYQDALNKLLSAIEPKNDIYDGTGITTAIHELFAVIRKLQLVETFLSRIYLDIMPKLPPKITAALESVSTNYNSLNSLCSGINHMIVVASERNTQLSVEQRITGSITQLRNQLMTLTNTRLSD